MRQTTAKLSQSSYSIKCKALIWVVTLVFMLGACSSPPAVEGPGGPSSNPPASTTILATDTTPQLIEPQKEQIQVLDTPTLVETAKYEVKVELPAEIPIRKTELVVSTSFSKAPVTSDSDGDFQVRMNTSGVGLISLTEKNNAGLGIASLGLLPPAKNIFEIFFPKHPLLKRNQPLVNVKNAAVSLMFAQPGIVTNDPVMAAVLMRLIERLPETQALADLIAQKLKTDPYILSKPDSDIRREVDAATSALLNKTTPKPPPPTIVFPSISKSEEQTPFFQHLDPTLNDSINLKLTLNPQNLNTSNLAYENEHSRWVAVFIVKNGQEELVDIIPPAIFQFPKVVDLAFNAVQNSFELFSDLFQGKQADVSGYLTKTVLGGFAHAEGQFKLHNLQGAVNPVLLTYGAGKNSPPIDIKMASLWATTILTEIIMPLATVAVDVDSVRSGFLDDRTRLVKVFKCMTATVGASKDFLTVVKSFVESGTDKDYTRFLVDMSRMVLNLMSDPSAFSQCKDTGIENLIENVLKESINPSEVAGYYMEWASTFYDGVLPTSTSGTSYRMYYRGDKWYERPRYPENRNNPPKNSTGEYYHMQGVILNPGWCFEVEAVDKNGCTSPRAKICK